MYASVWLIWRAYLVSFHQSKLTHESIHLSTEMLNVYHCIYSHMHSKLGTRRNPGRWWSAFSPQYTYRFSSDPTVLIYDSFVRSCNDIFLHGDIGHVESGRFWINPDCLACHPYEVYCDMEIAGGGWTLAANCKVTVDLKMDFANHWIVACVIAERERSPIESTKRQAVERRSTHWWPHQSQCNFTN